MPAGFHLLIAAQFVSALADNALLIVTIALLAEQGWAAWWAPMLKFGFTLSYVFLAPFVGPLADAWPKARLMAWMNGVKVVGAMLLWMGVHPALGFGIVGLGAAAYAPAKYGLVTELVPGHQLVAANGWIEVSVVGAALMGTVLGGFLVSPWLLGSGLFQLLGQTLAVLGDTGARSVHAPAMVMVLLTYAGAALLNLGIPDSGARYAPGGRSVRSMCAEFFHANRTLWRDAAGGLSLAVTTLFWGVGATLQFAVLRWAGDVLHLPLSQAAYLQASVAVGVVVGAGLAGRFIPLHAAERVLPVGVVLGLMTAAVAAVEVRWAAIALLGLVGAVGGVLVVPLNALLQHRGCQLLSAGRSIAVQGFNENASVLVMLAVYGALTAADVPVAPLLHGFGLVIAVAMAALLWRRRRQRCANGARLRG